MNSDYELIIIDYLPLFQTKEKINRFDRDLVMETFCVKLKTIAIKKQVPIIFTLHLSRDIHRRKDKRPTLSDLGYYEFRCDFIIFIYRDEYYHAEYVEDGNDYGVTYIPKYSKTLPKVDVELIVSRNRNTCQCGTAYLFFNRGNGEYFE